MDKWIMTEEDKKTFAYYLDVAIKRIIREGKVKETVERLKMQEARHE